MQPLLLALGAGALIALLRTPIIDLALHIVGGSEAVLEQARRLDNQISKDTDLYKLYNTNIHEIIEMKKHANEKC